MNFIRQNNLSHEDGFHKLTELLLKHKFDWKVHPKEQDNLKLAIRFASNKAIVDYVKAEFAKQNTEELGESMWIAAEFGQIHFIRMCVQELGAQLNFDQDSNVAETALYYSQFECVIELTKMG